MELVQKIDLVKQASIETVWPTRCCICDKPGYLLCPTCANKLSFIDHLKSCPKCGEPFGAKQCCACMNKNSFTKCLSATILNKDTGRIITLYKDSGERRLANVMAYFMSKLINKSWIDHNCVVTFIPSAKEAYTKRGFDHCEVLAKSLAKILNIEFLYAFKRPMSTDQRNLGRKLRLQNLGKKFEIIEKNIYTLNCANTNIILIDDVFTTGSTLNTACSTLKNYGFSTIYCVNFSRTF